jgi:hypothetical protein
MEDEITTNSKKNSKIIQKEEEPKINLGTFVVIKKLTPGRKVRVEQFLREAKDTETEKTINAWEDIYNQCMSRITT